MKKIIALLAAAVLLLSIAAVPAAASGVPRFYLEGPASARPGDTITVSLNVSGQYDAHVLNLMIFFDNTSFRFKSSVNGSALDGLTGALQSSGLHKDGNAVSFGVLMPSDPLTVQGELLKITFEVLSSASPNPVFTIGMNQFSNIPINGSETPIPYSVSDLSISINGGSGSGTTPAPAVTPKPIQTAAPHTPTATPRSQAPIGTPRPAGSPRPANSGNPTSRDTEKPGTGVGTKPTEEAAPEEKTPVPGSTPQTPGRQTTEAPAATDAGIATLDPANTPAPVEFGTDKPFDPNAAADADRSSVPGEPGAETSSQPGEAPADTAAPGGQGESSGLKTGLIIGGCVIAAGLAGLCTFLGIRAKKRGRQE